MIPFVLVLFMNFNALFAALMWVWPQPAIKRASWTTGCIRSGLVAVTRYMSDPTTLGKGYSSVLPSGLIDTSSLLSFSDGFGVLDCVFDLYLLTNVFSLSHTRSA